MPYVVQCDLRCIPPLRGIGLSGSLLSNNVRGMFTGICGSSQKSGAKPLIVPSRPCFVALTPLPRL